MIICMLPKQKITVSLTHIGGGKEGEKDERKCGAGGDSNRGSLMTQFSRKLSSNSIRS